jgi:RHS repeat-associated protein
VDVATGALYMQSFDVTLPGDWPLTWSRSYSTLVLNRAAAAILGPGWTSRYFASLTRTPEGLRLLSPEGHFTTFPDPDNSLERGGILQQFGSFQELEIRDGSYCLTRWNIDTFVVERYVFAQHPMGEVYRLASVEDATGRRLELTYDDSDRLRRIAQRPGDRALLLSYDASGRVASIALRRPDLELTMCEYAYDPSGRLSAVRDSIGRTAHYEYDDTSRMIREATLDGALFVFRYDSAGRCVYTSESQGYDLKRLRYRDAIRWTEVTNSKGAVARYEWNSAGQVVTAVDAVGAIRRTRYDEHGRIVEKTDPRSSVTKFEYDARGNRARIVDAAGQATTFTYNQAHLPVTLTDQLGNRWSREYDERNHLIGTIDPLGARTDFSYDDDGNCVRIGTPTGAVYEQVFRGSADVREVIDREGQRSSFFYDDIGYLKAWSGPGGRTASYEFDVLGNLRRMDFPGGGTLVIEHDAFGNMSRTIDAIGRTKRYRFGPCKRLLEITDALGGRISFTWDSEPGRLLELTNQSGRRWRFEYDAAGRVVREVGFDGGVYSVEYDPAGRWSVRTSANGDTTRYDYDLMGRVVRISSANGVDSTFEYDAASNLTSAANEHCQLQFVRDACGRVVEEQQGPYTVRRQYTPSGMLAKLETSIGHSVAYTFDRNELVRRVIVDDRHRVVIDRDAFGMETLRSLPGGVAFEQRYDAASRLVAQSVSKTRLTTDVKHDAGTSTPAKFIDRLYDYSGSPVSLLAAVTDSGHGSRAFAYDALERVVSVSSGGGTETYEYDPSSNIVATARSATDIVTYQHDPGDRLRNAGPAALEWDPCGNLVRKVVDGRGEQTFSWDAAGQLRSIRTPAGTEWTYQYDPLGRRVRKKGPTGETVYVWNGDRLLQEITEDAVATSWISDLQTFTPIGQICNGRFFAVIPDHVGTARELVDSEGRITWTSDYDVWGRCRATTVSGSECPWRFSGQIEDEETGLHYSRFRFYDPDLGRFISPDPVSLLGGLNLYAYGPNPINWIDPYGLAPLQWGNPKSTPTYGHTFLTHGQGAKNTRNLTGRAAGTGEPQGQWLNNQAAADFLAAQRPGIQGPVTVPIPPGMGQVILPDGRIVPATHADLVPHPDGGYRTAYPVASPAPPATPAAAAPEDDKEKQPGCG